MGCEDSKIGTFSTDVHLSVVDPSFLKPCNDKVRSLLEERGAKVDTYMSLDLFMSEQSSSYSKHVVVR